MADRSARRARSRGAIALVALAVVAVVASATAASTRMQLSAGAAPAQFAYGGSLAVTGTLSDAGVGLGGAAIELQSNTYPYHGFVTIAHAQTGSDGSYSFAALRPGRDTRLRVVLAADQTTASAVLAIAVDAVPSLHAKSLAPGQVRLEAHIRHVALGSSTAAWWYVAPHGSKSFRVAAVTRPNDGTRERTDASTTVTPPSQSFSWRVCLVGRWSEAMGAAAAATRACPHGSFEATPGNGPGWEAEADGRTLATFPSRTDVAAAVRYLDGRAGRSSLAVADTSGRISGVRLRSHFETASVIKVMFLTAFLQRLAADGRGLSAHDERLLEPMIHISDNDAASAVLEAVGEPAVERVAREAGMRDYKPGVGWWAFSQTSASDQVRMALALERLIPPQFYGYARGLMANIEPEQSWGFPPVARPRWQVFFKTGALPSRGLFNEVALLERPGVRFAAAVLTDGDPSQSYGEETIAGVARALLGE
ncbi:MAG TPA: serine hydrolase [Solirubrobacteraceae bacterium]|jgi:beta-lactamase class A|nr:serine hydrolase [Solirubrobacteraceae bacterium]